MAASRKPKPAPVLAAHREHPRRFEDFQFVYPVLSRRSRGISIGLNTNPNKVCNFDCVYCQVDRGSAPAVRCFDLATAEAELRTLVDLVQSGALAKVPPFDTVPAQLRRLNDIALSGDGEPTTLKNFLGVIEMVVRHKPRGVKLVLITNATGLERADVQRGLALMDAHDGEVWAKLDAGTSEYYRQVDRSGIAFERILQNIAATARVRPVVIQSLFLKLHGNGPSVEEVSAYCDRLRDIVAGGGKIKLVQICTVARRAMTVVNGVPAWQFVAALTDVEVDALADVVRQRTSLPVESYYGQA